MMAVVNFNPNQGDQAGLTLRTNPMQNFIANDVASSSSNTDTGLFALFIHELGNALGLQVGLSDPLSGFRAQNGKRGIDDPDVGAAFENCVFCGLVGLRS